MPQSRKKVDPQPPFPQDPRLDRGIYVLGIRLPAPLFLSVGALSRRGFPEGIYWYVGSAQRNLQSRLRRHLRADKPLRWHIDYLLTRPETRVRAIYLKPAGKSLECKTAFWLSSCGDPIAGFGASDCRCRAHLVHTRKRDASEVEGTLLRLGFLCREPSSLGAGPDPERESKT